MNNPHPKYGWFLPSETRSKDGAPGDIRSELREELNRVREHFGMPIRITSGFRSQGYNRAIGGARNSLHLEGLAVDINLSIYTPSDRLSLLRCLHEFRFTGWGYYPGFVHVDLRQMVNLPPAYWVG
jgi:zinc D-Ala-D-Ala carboxypeptidase